MSPIFTKEKRLREKSPPDDPLPGANERQIESGSEKKVPMQKARAKEIFGAKKNFFANPKTPLSIIIPQSQKIMRRPILSQ